METRQKKKRGWDSERKKKRISVLSVFELLFLPYSRNIPLYLNYRDKEVFATDHVFVFVISAQMPTSGKALGQEDTHFVQDNLNLSLPDLFTPYFLLVLVGFFFSFLFEISLVWLYFCVQLRRLL